MKNAWFFLVILIAGILFEVSQPIENKFFPEKQNWFILYNYPMALSSHVYYIIEHFITISSGVFIAKNVDRVRKYAIFYTVLEGVDLLDYFLTGNTMWFEIWGWPITYNAVKISLFVLFVINNAIPYIIHKYYVKS